MNEGVVDSKARKGAEDEAGDCWGEDGAVVGGYFEMSGGNIIPVRS